MLILVVDDEESLCELMAEVLAETNEVIKAYNGEEALQLARQHRPDIIVSDIMMPQMSGLELLKALRSDEKTQQIPVILLSAASPKQAAEAANAFIRKPFEIETLEKIVAQISHSDEAGLNNADSYSNRAIEAARTVPEARPFSKEFQKQNYTLEKSRYHYNSN